MVTDSKQHYRTVRSFVLRQGRMTKAQEQALEQLWPKFGLEFKKEALNFSALFENHAAKLIVEIGFGNGKSLAQMAANAPDKNFIGIEVHKPGVGALLMEIEKLQLSNLRCINHDALEVFEHMFPDNSIDGINLFFPDPWPKKRHHKRRIVKTEFLNLLAKKMKVGARFHMATDWQAYAEDAMEVLSTFDAFENESVSGQFSEKPDYRPKTRFEQRGENLGHGVWDLLFRRSV